MHARYKNRHFIPGVITPLLFFYFCECFGEVPEVEGYYTIDKSPICANAVLNPANVRLSDISQISDFPFPMGTTVLEKSFLSLAQNNSKNNIYKFDATFQVNKSCILRVCDFSHLHNVDHCSEYVSLNGLSQRTTISVSTRTIFNCSCETYSNEEYNIAFNRQYMGVVFQPYVKHYKPDGLIDKWNSYSIDEVQTMLRVISAKFTFISTYGIGAPGGNRSWEDGDSTGFVPVAAARLNQEFGFLRVQTLAAIWYTSTQDIDIFDSEIQNAFAASEAANRIFPNTVWGIIFTTGFVEDAASANVVIKKLKDSLPRARRTGLKMGIRILNCNLFLPPELAEANNGLFNATNTPKKCLEEAIEGSFKDAFKTILHLVDFVICVEHPDYSFAKSNVNYITQRIGKNFLNAKKCFNDVSPNVTLYGQTGWPSYGFSLNGSPNTIKNMRNYWSRWSAWSSQEKIQVFMFESIDEPWKSDPKISDVNSTIGVNGAEGHFGWWERVDGKFSTSYIEKYINISEVVETEGENEPNQSTSYQTWMIMISIGCVLSFCFIAVIYMMKRKLKRIEMNEFIRLSSKEAEMFMKGIPEGFEGLGDEDCHIALRFPYDKSYELSRNHFTCDKTKMIGQGSGGIVYEGEIFQIDGLVAFKTTCSTSTIANARSLLSEIKLLSYIGDHMNIVKFIGAHTEKIKYGEVYLAMEYCNVGSLEGYLQKNKTNFVSASPPDIKSNAAITIPQNYVSLVTATFSGSIEPETTPLRFEELLKWCFEIADAMEYLGLKKIVHADLACRNVLLTEKLTAKITDFGLSRKLYKYATYLTFDEETPLPWRWMAPESLKRLKFSAESDIWSYGVTLWEIFSFGDVPYPGLSWSVNFANQLESGLRLQKPTIASKKIYAEMLCCWNADPSLRGTFTKLKEFFQSIQSDTYDDENLKDLKTLGLLGLEESYLPYTYLTPLKRQHSL